MSVIPLIVTVSEPETGATWDYAFDTGPVVVGRGEGAQLCLDRPFVSLQHGTFSFDDAGVTYLDLDSRNGTLIDGVPRASDQPVPISETTELRIGKLRLKVSRGTAAQVVDERPSPFAPRPGRGAVKGTDALPREDLERMRREVVARKESPPPVVVRRPEPLLPTPVVPTRLPLGTPATPVVPVVLPLAAVVSTPAPPSEPGLDKTVPVPQLTSRPPGLSTPASTYAAGGTQAISRPAMPTPATPRPSAPRPTVRRTPREVQARPARDVRRRPLPPQRRSPWPAIAVGVVIAVAAAIALLFLGGGERRVREEPDPEPTGTGGAPAQVHKVRESVHEPITDPPRVQSPEPVKPSEPVHQPLRPTVIDRPRAKAPEGETKSSGNRSPILP